MTVEDKIQEILDGYVCRGYTCGNTIVDVSVKKSCKKCEAKAALKELVNLIHNQSEIKKYK